MLLIASVLKNFITRQLPIFFFCSMGANFPSNLLQVRFWSKCLGANFQFSGARNLLQRYHWTTLTHSSERFPKHSTSKQAKQKFKDIVIPSSVQQAGYLFWHGELGVWIRSLIVVDRILDKKVIFIILCHGNLIEDFILHKPVLKRLYKIEYM